MSKYGDILYKRRKILWQPIALLIKYWNAEKENTPYSLKDVEKQNCHNQWNSLYYAESLWIRRKINAEIILFPMAISFVFQVKRNVQCLQIETHVL